MNDWSARPVHDISHSCGAHDRATRRLSAAPRGPGTAPIPTTLSGGGSVHATPDGGFDDVPQQGIESAWGPHSIGGGFAFSSKRGGNQGGEGNDGAGEWFVTNVVEELDSDNEFW